MNINIDELKSDTKIIVRTWCEGLRLGIVENVDYDEGVPVSVSYVDSEGEGYWCYFDQIVRIVS